MSDNHHDELDDGSQPDDSLPEFDARAIRRATRRGIFRTALSVIGYLLLGSILLQVTTTLALEVGDRRHRLENVVIPGLLVANPEYESHGRGCCNADVTHLTGSLDIQLRSPAPTMPAITLEPTQDLLGRYDPYSVRVPESGLGQLVQGSFTITADQERRILQRLPDGMHANAVVLFEQPLDQAGVDAILASLDVPYYFAAVLFDVPQGARWVGSPVGTRWRIGWPEASLSAFAKWASSLSASDDATLHKIGLPRAADIQAISRGSAAGVVISSASVARLLKLIDDPAVRAVMPADVEYDLGIPSLR
jgi:hypothetical protein